jgi:DNA-binding PucR family transcriptional regulator
MNASAEIVGRVAAMCDQLDAQIGASSLRAARRIHRELQAYRDIPEASLAAVLEGSSRLALDGLRQLRRPEPGELEGIAAAAAERALQDVPLEQVLQAYRITLAEQWTELTSLAPAHDLEVQDVLTIASTMIQWSESVMNAASTAYTEVGLRLAREDQQRRDTFLRALLAGTLTDHERQGTGARYGLDPTIEYVAARVRARPGCWEHGLAHRVELALKGRPGLVGQVDGDTIVVSTAAPEPIKDTTIAVGPPARLHALHDSFTIATRVLQTAATYGATGVVALEDVSIRPAVLADQALGELFERRYLQPLDQLGPLGDEIKATIQTWFRQQMRIEETARILHVHPNTLRHRLRRFEELTNSNLRQVETLTEVWWALQRRDHEARAR